MTIKDLKEYFLNTENPKFFLTDVFSWRGIYDEVAFTPSTKGTKERSLELIEEALTGTYIGYKGGEFTYDEWTNVHFEYVWSSSEDNALYDLLLYGE